MKLPMIIFQLAQLSLYYMFQSVDIALFIFQLLKLTLLHESFSSEAPHPSSTSHMYFYVCVAQVFEILSKTDHLV